ncbi:hypothetical protein [Streptomyces sp. NPDC004050]
MLLAASYAMGPAVRRAQAGRPGAGPARGGVPAGEPTRQGAGSGAVGDPSAA